MRGHTTQSFYDLNHSIPFNSSLELSPEYNSVVTEITSAIISGRTKQVRPSSINKVFDVVNVVLANLVKTFSIDKNLFVGISLRREDHVCSRYERGLSYNSLQDVIKYLRREGYLTYDKGFYNKDLGEGRSTRIRMTEKLCQDPSRMGMLEPQSDGEGQDGSSGILITGTETIIQVFYPEIIRLKDREKELCFYDDTPATKRMRDNLNRFNVFASKHSIDLCVSDGEFRSVLDRKSPEESEERRYGWGSDQNERFIDLTRNRLHRVFNCSFDQGGRFYGGWWQGVPRAMRMYITINGEPTQELDYAGLHLAMLYAKVGEPLVGDPYILEGIGPEYRKLVKVTLMKMINAETGRMRRPEGMPLPPGMTWTTLRDAIAQSHPAIAAYLKSGEGIRLQRLDADVAEDVMLSMMHRGILVLPIHDSFVVDYRYADILRSEMLRAYRKRLGAEIGIEADQSMIDELVSPSEDEVRDFMARRQAGSDFRGYRERNRASQDRKSTRDAVEPSTPIQPRMSPHEITPTFPRPKSVDSESWTYFEYVAFWPLASPSPALVP